jgi:methionyl-tRNA formyltransferase
MVRPVVCPVVRPLRVVFAGTPEFAVFALASIYDAGFDIPFVLTRPDRPAGRGMKVQHSPVKQFALQHGLPVLQPASLRQGDDAVVARTRLEEIFASPDHCGVMVVAAYGLLLPQTVLDLPSAGCINIHASLLPRWRGAAPIHRAIEAGDETTGVTLMQMDAGLDTGPMLLQQALPISESDTAGTLHDKVARLGAELIVQGLKNLSALKPTPQPQTGVTYAEKIQKNEAALDFSLPAPVLARRIRAFSPFPGAWMKIQGETIKCWQAHAVEVTHETNNDVTPGMVLRADERGLLISCGQGAIDLTELQRAGGKRLAAREFLSGYPLSPGTYVEGG